jgi:rare lipoprotein A
MFQERDGEKEILLGNKQLLAIFFVLAILFGVFFTAGYMVGRTTGDRKLADTAVEARSAPADNAQSNGGETHSVSPEPSTNPGAVGTTKPVDQARTAESSSAIKLKQELTRSEEEQEPAAVAQTAALAGHTYLQVAALHRADAETVAKVLVKKGFQARISPKSGTPYYRVLVGPVHDAGELNSTRAALKNKGFREVFVQHL